jgi:hypothetical protein
MGHPFYAGRAEILTTTENYRRPADRFTLPATRLKRLVAERLLM